jgi:TolB-like protein/Tfp pilus assembly protein PilF
MSFIKELKRRNVFKVGIAYLISCWVIIQVADILLDNIGAPAWVLQTIFVVLGVGFFITLFFAWAFEMTPEGVKREKDVDRSESITNVTGQKLNGAIIGVLVVALAYFAIDKFILTPGQAQPGSDHFSQQTPDQTTPTNEKSALTPVEAINQSQTEAEPTISRQSIAVLPFANRSRQENDEFFVEGMHDDLLTNLARIGALKVISRTSVLRYKDTELPIPEIARELGVANIMEGAVQRSGNTVRINVQLIDAKTDEHLWAEIYDRELTAENLFAIQSEISLAIADALQATLTPDEKDRINTAPTENLQAHDAFLRGRQLMAKRESESLQQAIDAFQKAVELDPGFALAWVGLADSHNLLTGYGTLTKEESVPIEENAIKQALEINDELGEAYASQASLYQFHQKNDQAETAYLKAIELSPNYAIGWMWYSGFLNEFPLRIQEAIDAGRKAAELDPKSSIVGLALGQKYEYQGLYSLAERQYQRVMELEPGFAQAYRYLADLYQFSMGQYARALPLYEKAHKLDPGNVRLQESIVNLYLSIGDIQNAQSIRERMAEVDANNVWVGFTDVKINMRLGNTTGMFESINWLLPKIKNNPFLTQFMAVLSLGTGDTQRAREIYLSAQPGWAEPDQWKGLIENFATHGCVMSWVFLNTGDPQLGSDLLVQTTAFLDESLPAVMEHTDSWLPDICYLTAGDTEKALTTIETQLNHNHLDLWWWLHDLPMYEQVRFDPRYQAALAEYERRIALQREAIAANEVEL